MLFWLDINMTHLGIAKFLQEKKSDLELFAIVNARDQKKFFQNQSIVRFQKSFYLYDHISNPNYDVDFDYLVSIENHYKINLFQIADTDLEFHFSNTESSKNQILSILEQDCRFLESVLEEIKPDYLCVPVTDRHYHLILQSMCEAKGIKILMLCPSRLGHRWMIIEDLDKIDPDVNYETIQFEKKSFVQLKTYVQEFPFFKNAGKDLILYENSRQEKLSAILQYKKTMPRFIIKKLIQKRKKKSRNDFINKNFQRQINNETNFIFFPLHAEPERALYTSVPFYSNQLEVITNIAKSLPINFSLIVKDHPAMEFFGWRNPSFYKKIMSLPNVKIVHPTVKPNTIFEKCSGVISIGGSAGLEACFYNKPVILFGDLNFSIIPSVFKVEKLENLPKLIRQFLNTKPDASHLSKFVAYIEKYSFKFNLPELLSDLYNQFYYGGLKTVTNISEDKLNSYFEKHKTIFCNLAEEHIKKFEYYDSLEEN
jgi:hypothetical protein